MICVRTPGRNGVQVLKMYTSGEGLLRKAEAFLPLQVVRAGNRHDFYIPQKWIFFYWLFIARGKGVMVGLSCQILYDHRGERAKQGLGEHFSLAPKARRSVCSGAESELMMARDLTK